MTFSARCKRNNRPVPPVLMVGPSTSVHVRTWLEAFSSAGLETRLVSGVNGAEIVRSILWCRAVRRQAPAVTVVHSLGRHALLAAVCGVHGRVVVVPWGSEMRNARTHPLRKAVAQRMFNRAAVVMTTSAEMQRLVVEEWCVPASRAKCISWGVGDDVLDSPRAGERAEVVRRRLGIEPAEILVVAPRGTNETYRHSDIREAYVQARKERSDIRLVSLAGPRADRAAAVPGEKVVDTLSKADLCSLLLAADAVVSIPRQDQRSTTVMEAVAAGTQVILSSCSSYTELADEGLDIVQVGEPPVRDLVGVLTALSRVGPEDYEHNRRWCRVHERQRENMDRIVRASMGEK